MVYTRILFTVSCQLITYMEKSFSLATGEEVSRLGAHYPPLNEIPLLFGTMLDLFMDELDNVQGKREKKMEAYAIRLNGTSDSLRQRFSRRGENAISRLIRVSVAVFIALAITFLWVATAKAAM